MKKITIPTLLFVVLLLTLILSCNLCPEIKNTIATGVVFTINNGAESSSLDPHLIEGIPEHRIR